MQCGNVLDQKICELQTDLSIIKFSIRKKPPSLHYLVTQRFISFFRIGNELGKLMAGTVVSSTHYNVSEE